MELPDMPLNEELDLHAILMRPSFNTMKVLAGLFLLLLTNLPKAFVSMDKASRSFTQTYFFPTLPMSF